MYQEGNNFIVISGLRFSKLTRVKCVHTYTNLELLNCVLNLLAFTSLNREIWNSNSEENLRREREREREREITVIIEKNS